MNTQELTQRRDERWTEMRAIFDRAKRDKRDLTAGESQQFDQLEAELLDLSEQIKRGPLEARIGYGAVGITGVIGQDDNIGARIWRGMQEADFNLRANPHVEVRAAFGQSTPLGPGGLSRSHFLWPLLRRAPVDSLGISDFTVGTRTLSGTVERTTPMVSSAKATLAAPITAVVATVKQLALVINNIPQAVLDYESTAAAFFASEANLYLSEYLDAHIAAMIVAATPPHGTTGADTIVKTRNAIAAMRAIGQDPNVVVLNAADATALDLLADAGGYIVNPRANNLTASLWSLTVVERPLGSDVPLLLDTNRIGVLYAGSVNVLADPFTLMSSNQVNLRFEIECYMHVRDASAAYRISAT